MAATEPYYVTLASKKSHFPKSNPRKKPARKSTIVLAEEEKCPYLLFVPVQLDEEEEDADTYYTPKKTWQLDVMGANAKVNARREVCKGFLDQENMLLVVQIVTQHLDAGETKMSPEKFKEALWDLDIRNELFVNRIISTLRGEKDERINYQDVMNLLCEYISGTTLIDDGDGGKIERWKATVKACYSLFDPPEVDTGYIAIKQLKQQKGKRYAPDEYSHNSITFAMHKCLLDYAIRNEMTQVILEAEMEKEWETNPAIVLGFIEEVFRLILVETYEKRRSTLYM